MFRDRLLLGGFGALIGTLADGLIHWAAFLTGLAHSSTGHYLASIIFATRNLHAAQILLGELAHILAGSALGLAILLALDWSGFRAALLKGAGIGAVLWLNHVVIVPSFVAPRVRIISSEWEILVDLIGLIVWGAVGAAVIAHCRTDA